MASTGILRVFAGGPAGRFNFITMDEAPYSHLEQVEEACRAGIRWVQLRMKLAGDGEFLDTARAAKEICRRHEAILIINDRIDIAVSSEADGVHLGKEDRGVDEARQILGPDRIIGGTANTMEDIRGLSRLGADYVGLGPYRYTTTKKKLSPIVGLEGYREILELMKAEGVRTPVVAIGGIRTDDAAGLLGSGVSGLAFSGMLVHAADRKRLVQGLEAEVERHSQEWELSKDEVH